MVDLKKIYHLVTLKLLTLFTLKCEFQRRIQNKIEEIDIMLLHFGCTQYHRNILFQGLI